MLSLRSFVLILQHIVLCPKPSFVLVDSLPWIHGWNGTLHALTVSHHSKLLLTPTRAWTVYAAVHFTVILSCHRHEFKELRLYFILFQILRTPHPGTNSSTNLSSMHVSLRMIDTRRSYINEIFFFLKWKRNSLSQHDHWSSWMSHPLSLVPQMPKCMPGEARIFYIKWTYVFHFLAKIPTIPFNFVVVAEENGA